jgi:thiol-disulfide isomerase/thioredoxin
MHHQTRKVGALALLMAGWLWAAPSKIGKLQPVDEAAFERLVASGKGQVVLVNFWATWCAPCREEMPALVKLESKLRSSGFRLVTVSADEPEQEPDALRFLEQQGVGSPAYIKRPKKDEDFINAIDRKWVGALPASFLYDRAGKKARSFIGEVPMSELEAAIRKLL